MFYLSKENELRNRAFTVAKMLDEWIQGHDDLSCIQCAAVTVADGFGSWNFLLGTLRLCGARKPTTKAT